MSNRTATQHTDGVRPSTLAHVIQALGNRTLRVVAAPQGLAATISGTVLYDRFEPLPQGRGALLLASGLRENDPGWPDLVARAAAAGYSGIVMKFSSGDLQSLVAAATASRVALLSTPVETHWRDLDALVTGLIDARWVGLDPARGDPREMLDLVNSIASAAGGSVTIEDLDRRVLEYSSVPGQRIDDVRQAGILAHQVPDVTSNSEQYRRVFAAVGIVHFDAIDGEMARSAVAIRVGSRPLGTIWVIERPEGLSAQARMALVSAAPLAAVQLLLARHNRERDLNARGVALLAALEGLWNADDAAFASFPAVGTDFALVGFALFGSPQQDGSAWDPAIAQTGAMLSRYFAAFCAEASVAITARTVFVLIPRSAASLDRLIGAAIAAPGGFHGGRLKAAIAHASNDLNELPSMRAEVENVLGVTTSEASLPTVARLADVYARVVLKLVAEVLHDRPRLRHSGVDMMTAHDRSHDTEYAASVLAWLDAVGNINEAANRIGVHPNTLRYRLRRAGELFDFDLDRPDDRLSLWLHLRLLS